MNREAGQIIYLVGLMGEFKNRHKCMSLIYRAEVTFIALAHKCSRSSKSEPGHFDLLHFLLFARYFQIVRG